MPTPEERRIMKTQLWERDDRLNELIQRKADETKRLSDAVVIDLNRQMDDFKGYVYNLKKDYQLKFETNLMSGVERLEQSVQSHTSDLINAVQDQNEELNNMFTKFRKESDDKISGDIADRLNQFNEQAKELRAWWNDYKKVFADQMSKYQADTYGRYDELNKKVVALARDVELLKRQRPQ